MRFHARSWLGVSSLVLAMASACGCGNPCGNGELDADEACDDGNLENGDGCNARCEVEINCGDGLLDPAEECDDGNTFAGDGCSAECVFEGDGVCGLGVPVIDANAVGMNVANPPRFYVGGSFIPYGNNVAGACPGQIDDGSTGEEMIFKYVVPGSGSMTLTLTTEPATACVGQGMLNPNADVFDTLLHVRSDCFDPGSELGCNDDINTVLMNFCSSVTVGVNGGDTIFIALESFSDGNYGAPYAIDFVY